MANIKQIVSEQLSQRQRQINQRAERAALFDTDRLLCNIIRVDSNIDVPDRPGFVWCQEYSPLDDTSPFHAFNDKIQAREGLTVWIGKGLGGRREVLDWNNSTIVNTPDYAAQKYLPTHHSDHEWPDFKPGPDVVNVYPRSLSMLRTYPGEGGALTVSASPLRYIKGNALTVFPGKNSLDISASQPASGLALFVGIYLDPDDNTLKSVDGATTSDSPAITPDSPAFPESAILSANVRLNGDQTVFSEVDMVDVRQILDASGAIDGVRVSKLVSPDGLTDPVLSADNSGDVTLAGTGDMIVPDKIIHSGDTDTNIALADDDVEFTVGGLSMLKLTETTQDLITLGPGSGDVDINFNGDMFLLGSSGRFGIGTALPDTLLHLENVTTPTLRIQDTTTASSFLDLIDSSGTQSKIEKVSASGQALIDINPFPSDNAGDALFRFFRRTNTSGTVSFQVFRGDGTSTFDAQIAAGNTDSFISVPSASEFGVGTNAPTAKLHVDQSGDMEGKPVALFDQSDVSEEMFEFVSTIGVGNAIEAVGAKTLTVTHFIKVTLPGSLTRYFAVGTIA